MNTTSTPSERPLISCLTEKICSFNKEAATNFALQQARTAIIGTIAVTLAGSAKDCAQILMKTEGIASAPGSSLIFGTNRRTSSLDATLVNGTASHALDYGDIGDVFGGHPSVPLVAPLFALAEERNLSGAQVLLAYLVGVETEIKFARAVHSHHYDKGWHPTATLRIFGAVAAAAHLLKFDVHHTTMALAIAASLASDLKANFGTTMKPLHIGSAAFPQA